MRRARVAGHVERMRRAGHAFSAVLCRKHWRNWELSFAGDGQAGPLQPSSALSVCCRAP